MSSRPEEGGLVHGDWLEGCSGFFVEAGDDRMGRVAAVQRDAEGRPVAVVARGGLLRPRQVVVPIDQVAGVAWGSRRVVVDTLAGRGRRARRPVWRLGGATA